MDVLDLHGPEFLEFYIVLLAFSLVGAFALRRYLRQPGGDVGTGDDDLLPEQVAYLAGGPKRMVDATIAGLVQSNRIEVTGVAPPRLRAAVALDESASPLEKAVHGAVESTGDGGQLVSTVRQRVAPLAEALIEPLHDRGYIMTPTALLTARVLPAIVPLLCLALGIGKIAVGASRGRPVGFLIAICFVGVIATVILIATCPTRSRLGDKLLSAMKVRGAALRTTATSQFDNLAATDMMMAFALFGPTMLSGGPHDDLRRAMQPPQQGGSGCGSSSSCGSSGGSSCGGGGSGCGGGGCGGCGGS